LKQEGLPSHEQAASVEHVGLMMVCVNGAHRELPKGVSVRALIESFELKQESVVIELNQKVVDRRQYQDTRLKENDVLEIVQFVGGG